MKLRIIFSFLLVYSLLVSCNAPIEKLHFTYVKKDLINSDSYILKGGYASTNYNESGLIASLNFRTNKSITVYDTSGVLTNRIDLSKLREKIEYLEGFSIDNDLNFYLLSAQLMQL